LLTHLLEGTSEPFSCAHIDGRIISCNKAFADLTGYTRDELCRLSWKTDLTPSEYSKYTGDVLETLHRKKKPIKFEKEYLRKDGSRIYIELNMHLLCDEAGKPLYYFTFVHDLTERKKLEKSILDSEAALNQAQRMAMLGSWYYDYVEDRMSWSEEFCRILGYEPDQCAPGIDMYMNAICMDDRERVARLIHEVARTGKASYMEYCIVRPDGAIRYIHSESEALYDPEGRIVKLFGTIQDVTQSKLVEISLEDAKEQAELYVDLLSHDINNLNQVAIGYAELAISEMNTGAKNPPSLEKTIEMLLNISRLINNVRIIQRVKAGEIMPKMIDLGSLLYETIDRYKSVRGRKVVINFNCQSRCHVMATELLQDVFSNLISNAIKHSVGDITIDIDMRKTRYDGIEYCTVSVSDNGPGIPDEKKKALFTRFMRGTTKAKGTGLGLYLVKSLVETFKGYVWAEDRVSGDHTKGSKFVAMLPLVET
jgi:PAS domain S-box-containing protein